MPRMLTISCVLALLPVASPTSRLADEPVVPAEPLTVTVIAVNGSGCSDRAELTTSVAADSSAFTITFGSRYRASVGVGSRAIDSRKNCQINLSTRIPAGFTVMLAGAVHTGTAFVVDGATVVHRWLTYTSGASAEQQQHRPLAGPYEGPWEAGHANTPGTMISIPCGEQRNLNLNTEVRAVLGVSDPLTTASFSTLETSTYRLLWRACPGA